MSVGKQTMKLQSLLTRMLIKCLFLGDGFVYRHDKF